jgi:hypothetical protein
MPSVQPNTFSAPYDRTTRIVSAAACGILLLAAVATHNFFVGCISLLLIAVAYAYSPRGYLLDGQSVVVRRWAGDVLLPLVGVREARAATPDDFRGCIRLWGSGGLFGYYGLFRTSKLGKCTWYVTDRSRAVVLITAGRTALFSPDEVSAFLAAVRAAAPVAYTSPDGPVFDTEPSQGPGALIAVGLAIVGLAVAFFVGVYSPGTPGYTLTRDALTIHDRWYPLTLQARAVDVDHIRVVDFSEEKTWRPTARTNGFGIAHYHAGWFRVASGQTVRMYRADSNRLVLLPPQADGAPVLYEVKEPEKFVAEVRQEWSAR